MDTNNSKLGSISQNLSWDQIEATPSLIDALYEKNLLTPEARFQALDLILPPRQWNLWLSRIFLTLGLSLILSGVIFFFAYNWADLSKFGKFAVLEASIVVFLGAAYFYKIETLAGQCLMLCAAILVGIFLAVFGQIYQTGAEAYILFGTWALLIVPWVLMSNFAPLWAVWIFLVNFTCMLWITMYEWKGQYNFDWVRYIVILGLNGFFLAAREILVSKGISWVQPRWTRFILMIPLLFIATISTAMYVNDFVCFFKSDNIPNPLTSWGTLAVLGSLSFFGSCLYVYRKKLFDFLALTLTFFALGVTLEVSLLEVLDRLVGGEQLGIMALLMAITTLLLCGGAVLILRRISREMKNPVAVAYGGEVSHD